MASTVAFEDVHVGDLVPERAKRVTREDVRAYAEAGGDDNPLHQDDEFARSVGFPGVIAHGMFSMAHVARTLTEWLGDPSALLRLDVTFRAVVFMGETLLAKGQVVSLDPDTRRATLNVWAELRRDGKREVPIKASTAIVQLA
jgi:acyl dehydratase